MWFKHQGSAYVSHGDEMTRLRGRLEEALAAAQVRAAVLFDEAVRSGKATRAK